MYDDFDGPEDEPLDDYDNGSDYEYDDSQRLDEMNTAEDYNRWEEEQVFQDLAAGEGQEALEELRDGLDDFERAEPTPQPASVDDRDTGDESDW